ncbi:unnamed protein product [Cuscuta europaea]|uniref:N-acetyltransferase domain-containing protein n=1 Tax=Cuscuta europaea TaxID=41803 RepID=A0A9P0Z708_CUSEU|nr:unnamed protein product [Cuscuta europaea]
MAAVPGAIVELQRNSPKWGKVVDEIVRIEKRVFPKHESLAQSFDEELRKRNGGLLYMEDGEGEVAGYVMYACPSSLFGCITKLAVKEKYRRGGFGEALLKEAIQKCRRRNVQRVSLHVDPSRIPAVKLYEKLGFRVDTLVEGYYSAERSAYRMYIDFHSD